MMMMARPRKDATSESSEDHSVPEPIKPPLNNEDSAQPQRLETDDDASSTKEEEEEDDDEDDGGPIKLYKSPRFKGYLTIVLASVINYNAAVLSRDTINITSVPASATQQAYAKAVALVSAIITGSVVLCHLDRYSPLQNVWKQSFLSPDSYTELVIICFLLFWWFVATVVQTSVRGIAGDGKEQYNLYYSTWVCLWTTIWTLERKLIEPPYNLPTIRGFVTSWPSRAPGWIAIFVSCFFTLWWYVDHFLNTAQDPDRIAGSLQPFYATIPKSQYQWLVFVAAFTLLPSAVFIFVEIFRETKDDVKGRLETVLEGFCLLLLTAAWIPSVIVATTPGGFASLVGNAYFWTWATTVFVMETFLWFIHDFRGRVHKALVEKEKEYQNHQQQVLAKSKGMAATTTTTTITTNGGSPTNTNTNTSEEEEEEDTTSEEYYDSTVFANNIIHPEDRYVSPVATPPRFATEYATTMEMEMEMDEDEVAREMRLKQSNTNAYFDTLDDILE
jgi:hypothetical protein